ncbi:uncharacterized protein LOC121837814, partial [Ixodes scapularis]|uniref:uncharacterized protein LOC121837814 n=1 Tax=Ixodes scapularis TaxID=6945 RepID=UPI001C3863F7
QVRGNYGKCIRSDNLFLFVLPCPRSLCPLLCDACSFIRDLLLLGGDVETNPGPGMEKILEQLKKISDDLQEIKSEKIKTNVRLLAIEQKMESITALEGRITACEEQMSIDDLENRSRRSNLIVYGIPEIVNESNESLDSFVTEKILKEILEVQSAGFERIHRLGKKMENKTRPVIFKLFDFRDKAKILKNCYKLKGTIYAISEDFSRPVQEIRKKLWNSAKENRDRREKVQLVFDKIKINGSLFVW